MKRIAIAIAAALLAGTAGMAAAAGQMEGSRDIHAYQKAAEAEVSTMPAGPMVDWQALDGHTLAVWTANDKPWLVSVDSSCSGLASARSVQFTSQGREITAGKDSLKVGNSECRVQSIRPVNYQKVAEMHREHMKHTRRASNMRPDTHPRMPDRRDDAGKR